MNEVQIDLMNNGAGQGQVADTMMSGTSPGHMRPYLGEDGKTYIVVHKGGDPLKKENYQAFQVNTTGTLRRDEWKALDEAVVKVAETRLTGINDLVSRGLVYNLGNGFGTTVLETTTVSDALNAELTMDAVARAKGDRQTFSTTYLPLPIIHCDYEINARVLAASRNMGNALDTSMAERASRKVAEKLESMLFTATTYAFGGGTIYSYLNYPHRNTMTLGTAWTSETGVNIVKKVSDMKQESLDNLHYGPWVLYIPPTYETRMDADYSDVKGTNTIRERILQIAGITDVKVIDTLPDGHVLLVQMTSDVVRLVRGMAIQNVQWNVEGNMVTKFKVMTIQVPQLRSDDNNKTGIVHATGS